jgi:hypothetical protein
MLCKSFQELSPEEKQIFIGELAHAVQSDENIFHYAQTIIGMAKRRGLFKNVTILSEIPEKEETFFSH